MPNEIELETGEIVAAPAIKTEREKQNEVIVTENSDYYFDFKQQLEAYIKAKSEIKRLQDYCKRVDAWLNDTFFPQYSPSNTDTGTGYIKDEEGRGFKLEFKVNRKIKRDGVDWLCKAYDLKPEEVCKVEYSYLATKVKEMSTEVKSEFFDNCVETFRAKTAVEVIK